MQDNKKYNIDVSECRHHNPYGECQADALYTCSGAFRGYGECKENQNCYFRQTKIKEYELEKVWKGLDIIVKMSNKQRSALDKIEEFCKKDIHTFADGSKLRYTVCDKILEIIDQLKKG